MGSDWPNSGSYSVSNLPISGSSLTRSLTAIDPLRVALTGQVWPRCFKTAWLASLRAEMKDYMTWHLKVIFLAEQKTACIFNTIFCVDEQRNDMNEFSCSTYDLMIFQGEKKYEYKLMHEIFHAKQLFVKEFCFRCKWSICLFAYPVFEEVTSMSRCPVAMSGMRNF